MVTPLLRTKLYIPPIRPGLVPRPRLIERLNAGLHCKLTLISAPAGFGKTTLLSEWVGSCRQPVAWLSLDERDNDPVCFWTYLVAALQTIPNLDETGVGASVLAARQSPQAPPADTFLIGLINEMAEITTPFALILDDLHLITEPQIHDGLTFLLDNLPPQTHLTVAGRADPPWPLARLRARGEMTELRTADLRFTPEEATTFLNSAVGFDFTPEDVATLEARTEGWIAGLQMAAISMQGRRRTQGAEDLTGFIKAFTGSHRFILDYLVEEVLEQQLPEVQKFLLKTSILDRLTASLCDVVVGRDDSHRLLLQLDQANLFLIPLDDERCWYRYHHLFADLLRSRLPQAEPDQVSPGHCRASEWYEQNGLIAEAMSHALQAGDVDRVARLVEENALAMMDHGELATLLGWLSALPDEVVRSRPWLCIALAWVLAYTGQVNRAEPYLQDAEQASDGLDSSIIGHVAAARAYVMFLKAKYSRAVELARRALEYLPDGDPAVRSFVALTLGSVLRVSGDLDGAVRSLTAAVEIGQTAGDSHVAVLAHCTLARVQISQGRLHQAAASCQKALQLAQDHGKRGGRIPSIAGLAHTRMSGVLREWNDLETAIHHAREGMRLCERWGEADVLVGCCVDVAQTLQATGDIEGALSAIGRAKQIAGPLSALSLGWTEAVEAKIQLRQGDIMAASRWAQKSGLAATDDLGFPGLFRYIMLSRVLLARGEVEEALELSVRLLRVIEPAGVIQGILEALILQALALQAQSKVEEALSVLTRALALAEPEGYVRTFIDEGAPMGELLQRAVSRGIAVDYAQNLLAALESDRWKGSAATKPPLAALIEPLSERELEVLRLLVTNLSAPEIAEELFVSVSTVRSHTKSIYGKLNVHRRWEAVERAKELGLL